MWKAAAEMARPLDVAGAPLVVLAHVDELEVVPLRELGFHVIDRDLANAGLRVVHDLQETRAVVHGEPPSAWRDEAF